MEEELKEKVKILINKCDNLDGLLTADLNAFENWGKELDEYFDALNAVKMLLIMEDK